MDQERRLHPRFGCSGEASLRITPTWPVVRGTILDLSIGGCRIDFAARQRIQKDQKVELIFSVHNLPFHVMAVVRGERGKGQYGFEFPQLIERTRVQLQDLIHELELGLFHPEQADPGSMRLS